MQELLVFQVAAQRLCVSFGLNPAGWPYIVFYWPDILLVSFILRLKTQLFLAPTLQLVADYFCFCSHSLYVNSIEHGQGMISLICYVI